ncbi:MAG: hypothetical protein ACJZ9F_00545 [Rhodospirillaceae bacterium]
MVGTIRYSRLKTIVALALGAIFTPLFCDVTCATSFLDEQNPSDISLNPRGHGWIINTAQGMTLYTYVKDPVFGEPQCRDICAKTWPPMAPSAGSTSDGDWTIVKRQDNSHQWVFRGKPLYKYSGDTSPGDMNGDELLQQWFVAVKSIPLPPGFKTHKTPYGYLLTDQKNMTLYTSSTYRTNSFVCDHACTKTWAPVEAWWRAHARIENWMVIERTDGTKQWSYKGQPLYRYRGDYAAGEIAGEAFQTWSAVILEPPTPTPDWITYQKSDAGPLLADANGKTLYAHDLTGTRAFGIGIGRDMATPHLWTPVYADGTAGRIGFWSVVALDDGRHQWTYKGLKLYVHERDTQPGDLNGQRSTDRYWRTIMKDGLVMPGSGR